MAELPEPGLPAGGRASAQGLNTAPKSSGGSAPGPLDCAVCRRQGVWPLWAGRQSSPGSRESQDTFLHPSCVPGLTCPTGSSPPPCPGAPAPPPAGIPDLAWPCCSQGTGRRGCVLPAGGRSSAGRPDLLWWGLGARQHVAPAASPLPPGPPPLRHACWASQGTRSPALGALPGGVPSAHTQAPTPAA